MGFLNKLFSKGAEETDWMQLESEDSVEEVFAASGARVQLISMGRVCLGSEIERDQYR